MDLTTITNQLDSAISENEVIGALYDLNVLEIEAIHNGCIDQLAQDSISIRLRIAARLGWLQTH